MKKRAITPWSDVLNLARAHRLSPFDAAYLELALRRGLGLATLGQDLKAGVSGLGVSVFYVMMQSLVSVVAAPVRRGELVLRAAGIGRALVDRLPYRRYHVAGESNSQEALAMPQYVFLCQDCNKEFTRILHFSELEQGGVACPHCGGKRTTQAVAAFSAVTSKKS